MGVMRRLDVLVFGLFAEGPSEWTSSEHEDRATGRQRKRMANRLG